MVRRLPMVAALCLLASATPASAQQEIDNVAAFARLYGVVRWFYPSDASAALDWNRFAVEGVRRVREARTPAELETTLVGLFTPLGPGIEIGTSLSAKRPAGARDPELVAWHYRGAAMTGQNVPGPYSAKRMNRRVPTQSQPAATSRNFAQVIVADTLRGRTIRMRGQLRVDDPNAQGWAGLWLRVDRAGQAVGFFDNMYDRPVRDTAWREYVIQGTVDSDAERITFGAISVGSMRVDVDAIELAVRDAAGNWKPLSIVDASFEGPPAGGGRGWSQGAYTVIRSVPGAAHGERFARIAPAAVSQAQPAPGVPSDSLETPIAGASIDVQLARGLTARVPMSLTDAEARAEMPSINALRAAIASVGTTAGRSDPVVRLADAVVAWNVFRHFYPYWGDISVDWDARLRPQLETALGAAETRDAHLDAIRAVVADIRDGHGGVYDVATRPTLSTLPVELRILGGQLVVTASADDDVPVGSVVTTIDGTRASARIDREALLASGTVQWRQHQAARAVQGCRPESVVTITIEPPSGSRRDVTVPCSRSAITRAREARPDSIVELEPGIWYVDLTRARAAQLAPMLDALAKARGVVFDMRGYPTDAGAGILPYLIREAEESTDSWMHVARIARPFGEVAAWESSSWNLRPAPPQISGQRVFLTDGRAISYAESVMGYVRDHKLGTIIGGATAGANGNVASFAVPGGFSIAFTGMRVTQHDGRTPFHAEGVTPDIPLEPTLAGIRAGRDELLERALVELGVRR